MESARSRPRAAVVPGHCREQHTDPCASPALPTSASLAPLASPLLPSPHVANAFHCVTVPLPRPPPHLRLVCPARKQHVTEGEAGRAKPPRPALLQPIHIAFPSPRARSPFCLSLPPSLPTSASFAPLASVSMESVRPSVSRLTSCRYSVGARKRVLSGVRCGG